MSCEPGSLVALISGVSGGVSFASWLVALLPQLLETYKTKSVEGLSPVFVLIWFLGDVFSFAGCVLTEQMFFQYLLASYFLMNDMIMLGQYYYYGYHCKKHHHKFHHLHTGHSHSCEDPEYGATSSHTASTAGAIARASIPAVVVASQVGSSEARQLLTTGGYIALQQTNYKFVLGTVFAWISAALYFFSRVPQLWRNYKRKSTDDVSPFLFGCCLIGNATYAISILVSCDFIYGGDDRWPFFLNELPYMIGSAGTIVFDIVYFYQLWLYSYKEPKDFEEQPLLTNI